MISSTLARSSGIVSSLYTPKRVDGMILWLDALDAATITLNGSDVSAWDGKTGGGNDDAAQTTASLQPAYGATSFNSKPSIIFSGAESLSLPSLTSASGDYTFTFVIDADGGGGIQFLFDSNTPRLIMAYGNNSDTTKYGFYESVILWQQLGLNVTGQQILTFTMSGTTVTLHKDGVLMGTGTYVQTALSVVATAIGSNGGASGSFYSGKIAEILGYNRVLTTAERERNELYEYNKWIA